MSTANLPESQVQVIEGSGALHGIASSVWDHMSGLKLDFLTDVLFNRENSVLARILGLDTLLSKPSSRTRIDAPPPPVYQPSGEGQEDQEFYDEYALTYKRLAEHNRSKTQEDKHVTSESASDMPFFLVVGLAAAGAYFMKKK